MVDSPGSQSGLKITKDVCVVVQAVLLRVAADGRAKSVRDMKDL